MRFALIDGMRSAGCALTFLDVGVTIVTVGGLREPCKLVTRYPLVYGQDYDSLYHNYW